MELNINISLSSPFILSHRIGAYMSDISNAVYHIHRALAKEGGGAVVDVAYNKACT